MEQHSYSSEEVRKIVQFVAIVCLGIPLKDEAFKALMHSIPKEVHRTLAACLAANDIIKRLASEMNDLSNGSEKLAQMAKDIFEREN
jgi:hypothetical protein